MASETKVSSSLLFLIPPGRFGDSEGDSTCGIFLRFSENVKRKMKKKGGDGRFTPRSASRSTAVASARASCLRWPPVCVVSTRATSKRDHTSYASWFVRSI